MTRNTNVKYLQKCKRFYEDNAFFGEYSTTDFEFNK